VVHVLNGSGTTGRAAAVAAGLVAQGFDPRTSAGSTDLTAHTVIRYPTRRLAEAQALAARLHLPATALEVGHSESLVLTIGSDWTSGTVYSGQGADGAVATAPEGSHAQTADGARTCAPVSTAHTVELNGVPMNPTQAYARASTVPDSAP
jgi:hypothetical protein